MSFYIRSKPGLEPGLGRIFASTALVLTLSLSACGASPPDRSGNLTSVDEVLAAARDAFSSVTSYRLELVVVAISQADGREILGNTFNLIWSVPDRVHVIIESFGDGEEAQRYEYITTDGRVMVRRSTTGDGWVEYGPDEIPDNMEARGILASAERFSPSPDFVPDMDKAELVGKTEIDGLNVYHVKGSSRVRTEPPDDMPADIAADFPIQQTDTAFDLYISVDDLLPRRLVWVVDLTWENLPRDLSENQPPRTKSTVDYLDLNAPVTIELPETR